MKPVCSAVAVYQRRGVCDAAVGADGKRVGRRREVGAVSNSQMCVRSQQVVEQSAVKHKQLAQQAEPRRVNRESR